MKFLQSILLLLIALPLSAMGQGTVMYNTASGRTVLPTNFWSANVASNSAAIEASGWLSAGINAGVPNGTGALLHWSKLLGVPAGFEDGTDDYGAGLWQPTNSTLSYVSAGNMTNSINAGFPNGTGALLHWSQLLGVPAGFSDGTDDGGGGGGALLVNGGSSGTNMIDTEDFRWTASGGDISGVLSNTTVTAGSYAGLLSATVDSKGRLTALAASQNGASVTNLNASSLASGTLPTNRLDSNTAALAVAGFTGTGPFVRSDSPTLTGTLTADQIDVDVFTFSNSIPAVKITNATPSILPMFGADGSLTNATPTVSSNLLVLGGGEGGGLTAANPATNANQFVTLAQAQSFNVGGQHFYFTPASASGFALTGTVRQTNWASASATLTSTTNTITSVAADNYVSFISTNTFSALSSGSGDIDVWCYENTAGSATVKAEVYLVNSVTKVEEFEFEPSPAYQTVFAGTTPTKLTFSVPVSDYTSTTNLHVMVKLKFQVTGSPSVSIVMGGAYASHFSFSVPDNNFVAKAGDAMTGVLTLSGTATPGTSNSVAASTKYADDTAALRQPLDSDLTTLATLNGSALTNLNASELRSGTVPTNRLDANTVQLAVAGTTGTGTFMRTRTGVARTLIFPAGAFMAQATEGATPFTNTWATTTDRSRTLGWRFSSTSTNGINAAFVWPMAWGAGTVNVRINWKEMIAEANTTNVWSVALGSAGDGDTMGNILGTAVAVLDQTKNSTNALATTSWSSAVTVGNTPAAGDRGLLSIQRHPGNTSDNFAQESLFLDAVLEFTESTTEPTDN
jgi:hypothetical protein